MDTGQLLEPFVIRSPSFFGPNHGLGSGVENGEVIHMNTCCYSSRVGWLVEGCFSSRGSEGFQELLFSSSCGLEGWDAPSMDQLFCSISGNHKN